MAAAAVAAVAAVAVVAVVGVAGPADDQLSVGGRADHGTKPEMVY